MPDRTRTSSTKVVKSNQRQSVRAVDRVLDIFEAISGREIGLAELGRETALSPATVHRLVGTLMARDYVIQDDTTGRYLLGYRLVELAEGVRQRGAHLEAVTQDIITQLAHAVGESVSVAALDHGLPVYIAQAAGERSMRMVTRVGQAVPLHSTAVGKAILAFMPEDRVDTVLAEAPFDASTRSTITAAEPLRQELSEVRSRGFGIEQEEFEEGVASVAAPIFSIGAEVVGALSVSAPIGRAPRSALLEWGGVVARHSAVVSERLGGRNNSSVGVSRVRSGAR